MSHPATRLPSPVDPAQRAAERLPAPASTAEQAGAEFAAARQAGDPSGADLPSRLRFLQRSVGNRAVGRLVQSGGPQRGLPDHLHRAPAAADVAGAPSPSKPHAAPPDASSAYPEVPTHGAPSTPATSDQPAHRDAPAGSAVTPTGFPTSDAASPTSTGASTSTRARASTSAGTGVGGGGGLAANGDLTFITTLGSTPPSRFAQGLATASQAGVAALGVIGDRAALSGRPLPTGLAPGSPVAPLEGPAVAAPVVSGPPTPPTPMTSAPASGAVDADGHADAARADEWGHAGETALDAVATSGSPTTPQLPPLSPTQAGGELPTLPAPKVAALPAAPDGPTADPATLAVLDHHMAPSLRALAAPLLAPALAAGQAHKAEVGSAKNDVESGLDHIATEARSGQTAENAAAQRQVADQHRGWLAQRSSIVQAHKAGIVEASGRAHDDARRTMAEADQRAKAQADAAEKAQQADAAPKARGWWDRIKSAGRAAVNAIGHAASAVIAAVSDVIDAARRQVANLLQRLGDAIRQRIDAAARAVAAVARRAWTAMNAALSNAVAAIARLARAAADFASRLWAQAKARLAAAWQRLQSAVAAALAAARALVNRIATALATLKDILKILASGALQKLFVAARDPAQLLQPLVAKAEPFIPQVLPKGEELLRQQPVAGAAVASLAAAGPSPRRLRVHRSPDAAQKSIGDQAAELFRDGQIKTSEPRVAPARPGEGFWSGVWRHMKGSGNQFVANWKATLINVAWSLLAFYPALLQEGPKLWEECKGVVMGGGGVDRFDHVLGVLRHLVNMVAALVATTGIWALILGAFTGPGEAIVVGAYEAISATVVAADVALGLAELGKDWYSATRLGISNQTRETYLAMAAGSAISAAITIILVVLGAIASRLGRALRARKGPLPLADDKPAPVETGGSTTDTTTPPAANSPIAPDSDPANANARPERLTQLPPQEVARLVYEESEGRFRLNRKRVANEGKIVGEPEAGIAEHAAREAYAAERAAGMPNVEKAYLGEAADELINGSRGQDLSADVVGVTRNGKFVLVEAKGTGILHGLEQLEHSAQQLGVAEVVRYELVVAEEIRTPGFTIQNQQLYLNGQAYKINGKPVHVRTTR